MNRLHVVNNKVKVKAKITIDDSPPLRLHHRPSLALVKGKLKVLLPPRRRRRHQCLPI